MDVTTFRRHLLASAYVAVCFVAVFAYHSNSELLEEILFPWVGVSVAAGLLINRAWAVALPFIAFVIAVPLGYPEPRFEEFPTAYTMLWLAVIAAVLIGVALTARHVGSRWHRMRT